MDNTEQPERILISFFGLRLDCTNPTNKTIIILGMVLLFMCLL